METEHLEKRFGIVAVEKGFITSEHLVSALKEQIFDDVSRGEHRLLGRILFEQNLITMEQINEVLDTLGKGLPLLKEMN